MRNRSWLKLAVSEEEVEYSRAFTGDGYAFSTDGYRIHITRWDKPPVAEETNDVDFPAMLEALHENAEKRFEMIVNPVFLLDALEGLENQYEVKLEAFVVEDRVFLRLTGLYERQAYIMGKYENESWKERSESLAEKMPNKKENASASSDTNPKAPR